MAVLTVQQAGVGEREREGVWNYGALVARLTGAAVLEAGTGGRGYAGAWLRRGQQLDCSSIG